MGNDLDVCSQDSYLEEYFQQQHGPANESVWQFITRSSEQFCNNLIQPRRYLYDSSDLDLSKYYSTSFSFSKQISWEAVEFNAPVQERNIRCCFWRRILKPNTSSTSSASSSEVDESSNNVKPICIIYLHTNLRSMADALEVFPLAEALQAHVLSMDLPGCGQSDGQLHGDMDKDIAPLIDWAKCLAGDDVQVVLWARGLATAPSIHLCAQLQRPAPSAQTASKSRFSFFRSTTNTAESGNDPGNSSIIVGEGANTSPIKVIILDSPFTAIQEMVKVAMERMHGRGYTLTKSILQWGVQRILHQLSQKLNGLNLFSVKPISEVHQVRIPAFILCADEDDYIPADHGAQIAAKWGGPVQCATFSGKHFGQRSAEVVLSVLPFIRSFLDISTSPSSQTKLSLTEGVEEKKVVDEDAALHFLDIERLASLPEVDESLLENFGIDVEEEIDEASLLSRSSTYPGFHRQVASFASLPSVEGSNVTGLSGLSKLRSHSLTSLALRGIP